MPSPRQLADFFAYLRFPSVSADPEKAAACAACAAWLRDKFLGLGGGFRAELHARPQGPPVVVARSRPLPGRPTILVYGHYDVQPVDPLALWHHPPFEPVVKEGLVFARGATDNKGQTFAHFLGTEALLRDRGELPVNLVYLLEGEEEIGSPHLGSFLADHRDALACDAVVVSDTGMAAPGFPALTCGLRGIACLEVTVTGPRTDLHSGVFGGAVLNPAHVLARLLARLHDEDGNIAIPGFHDGIEPLSELEKSGWNELTFLETELARAAGVPSLEAGERGRSLPERIWSRPTAEINGLISGYQGEGSKTIIPSWARAKLSFRLVPGQDPDRVAARVKAHLESSSTEAARIEVLYDHGGHPYRADPTAPAARAAREALAEVFGRPPVLNREGLSIPVVSLFKTILGRDTLLLGLGLPDCNAHAPNESFPLTQLDAGIALHKALLDRLSSS